MDDTYSAARYIAQLTPIPLLLLHGTQDAVIPHAHSQRLLAEARDPKRLLTVEGGQHIDAFTTRWAGQYQSLVLAFIESALSIPINAQAR